MTFEAMFIPKGSKWIGWRNKLPATLIVASIWGRGGGSAYEPVSYELEQEETGEIIPITREKMIELISNKKLERIL